jgi:outer membrane protein TolC
VENGLVTFLRAQNRTRDANQAVNSEMAAFKQALAQYKGGLTDYNRVVLIQERLVERQQTLAEAQGQIALGLIQVYRALGGGWQIRCGTPAVVAPPLPVLPVAALPDNVDEADEDGVFVKPRPGR